MTIEEEISETEKERRDRLYKEIGYLISSYAYEISKLEKFARDLGQKNVNIPNVAITVNNKFGEYDKVFKEAGLSMYADINKKYSETEYIEKPFVAEAIIDDLKNNLDEAHEKFCEYMNAIEKTIENKTKEINARTSIWGKIKAFFIKTEPLSLLASGNDMAMLNRTLEDYKDINDKIWEIRIEDRIIPALVKKIAGPYEKMGYPIKHQYSAIAAPSVVEKNVIPELKRLGFEGLIPMLKEALIEEYKKDLSDPEANRLGGVIIPEFDRENRKPIKEEYPENNYEERDEL